MDDRTYTLSNSQGNTEEQGQQELLESRQEFRPHHGPFFYSETSMYPLAGGSDMDHDEISTMINNADVNEGPSLPYELPSSNSICSIGQPIPEHPEDLHEYDNSQRLTDQPSQDDLSSSPHSENDQDTRDSLMIDAIDEDYNNDGMEEPVLLIHHNFEDELPSNDYRRHESMTDMHSCSEDVDPRHGHQAQLSAGPESESKLATRPRFLESDEAEGVRDGYNDPNYWQMQSTLLGSDGCLVPRENEQSQLGLDDYFIRNLYDSDSLTCARDQSLWEYDEGHYCEHASVHMTDVFMDNNCGFMATQQEALDDRESVGGELYGNEGEQNFSGDVAEGEDACRPSISIYHHDHLSDNVVVDEDSHYEERPSHLYWTASSHCTGSKSVYA